MTENVRIELLKRISNTYEYYTSLSLIQSSFSHKYYKFKPLDGQEISVECFIDVLVISHCKDDAVKNKKDNNDLRVGNINIRFLKHLLG